MDKRGRPSLTPPSTQSQSVIDLVLTEGDQLSAEAQRFVVVLADHPPVLDGYLRASFTDGVGVHLNVILARFS